MVRTMERSSSSVVISGVTRVDLSRVISEIVHKYNIWAGVILTMLYN